jgi:hypothetical protein
VEVSYILEGERRVCRLPNSIADVTVKVAANIFRYAQHTPPPKVNETLEAVLGNNPELEEVEVFVQATAYQKALDAWYFGFVSACCIEGEFPKHFNLAEYAVPEATAQRVREITDKMLSIRNEMFKYEAAPIKDIKFKGVRYTIPAKIGAIRTGRAVRTAAYAESLDGLAKGNFENIAQLCASILFTKSELNAELSDIRQPIHNSVFDARAKLFLDLPYTFASDVAFFLLVKSKNYKRYLDMRSTQAQIARVKGTVKPTKKAL